MKLAPKSVPFVSDAVSWIWPGIVYVAEETDPSQNGIVFGNA
jgi:hypothetical protein